ARYRVGGGTAGNVGPGTITRIVTRALDVDGVHFSVHNPMAAVGGTEPETIQHAKQHAPHAFRSIMERAVTGPDYASLTQRDFADSVQAATGRLGWMGSWHEADVAVDERGFELAEASLLGDITLQLERYRRIGHDLAVSTAVAVALDIELCVVANQHALRGHVKTALLNAFSTRRLSDGSLGFFHPDNITPGSPVYLSRLVAKAMAVEGVESATVTRLQRYGKPAGGELEAGVLRLHSLEVARVDNDTAYPEHGVISFKVVGGR
ncbi:MAG: putative baseplate assembly protein, partial [Chloroflexota bacterium]